MVENNLLLAAAMGESAREVVQAVSNARVVVIEPRGGRRDVQGVRASRPYADLRIATA